MGAPISSYATAGIVSGELEPHLHDKVETPSAEKTYVYDHKSYM
jgi:hypothetical protein